MRIALLTTDNREHQKTYEEAIPRFGPAIEAVLDGLSRVSELEVDVIACTQQPMQAPEKLSDNTWFHLLHVPKIGWLRTGYQGCVRAIRKKLRDLQPDLVHGEGTERECALSAALSGFTNVVTIHGNMGEVAKKMGARIGSFLWCAARLEAYTLRRASGVFCNSAYTECVARQYNQRTWRVPNALRLAFFDTPIPSLSRAGKPIILNIGSIVPYKRQLKVLEVAESLHREGNEFEIHFVSSAARRGTYAIQFFERLQNAERAGFARHVDTRDLSELIKLYDTSSALVHIPSEESFGLVVAEALARNRKLFATKVGGVPDIANSVEDVELFTLGDQNSLKTAVARWLQEGCPRQTYASNEMRTRYHPDVIAAHHLKIYREILAH